VKRGELYRVFRRPGSDPRKSRVFVIVSRQVFIDSKYSTAICAPVYSERLGLSTQVNIGPEEGLKTECCIHCDELVSLPKSSLTNYVGSLPPAKYGELSTALKVALDIE
jgi:mRNA interferase MazF